MSAPLRWGVIGLGRAGLAKLKALSALGERRAEIRAVATRRPLADELRAAHPRLEVMDASSLLRDPEIDAVAICTESALHFQQAHEALSCGKHTLVDFPLCASLKEFDQLFRLAKERELTLHQELIGLLAPSHTLITAQLSEGDPLDSLSIHFRGGLEGWVAEEARAGRWALLSLGRLTRAWDLAGPLSLSSCELLQEQQGYKLTLELRGEGGAQVRLQDERGLGVRRSMRLEARSRAGRALHDAVPRPLPPPEKPLFLEDLERFDHRARRPKASEASPHYVSEEAQRGVMALIDQLSFTLSKN